MDMVYRRMKHERCLRSLVVALLLLITQRYQAQSTGTLRLVIDPGSDYEFVVDHKHRMQQREIKLGEGLHHFSVWAPERRVVDTSVFVVADRTSELVMRLPYSAEFMAHRNAEVRYQNSRKLRVISPVILVAGGVWTGLSYMAFRKADDQLQADRKEYANSTDPGVIANLKDVRIPEHNATYERARTSMILGGALTAIGAGVFWYIRSHTKGLTRPVFEDKERIRFDGLSWIDDHRGGTCVATLSIPIVR